MPPNLAAQSKPYSALSRMCVGPSGLSNQRQHPTGKDYVCRTFAPNVASPWPPASSLPTRRDAESQCGLQVIDLRSGVAPHWLRLEGMVTELNDVAVLPRVVRPMVLGLKTDEIARMLTVGEAGKL